MSDLDGDHKILPFMLPDDHEGSITRLHRRSLRLGRRMLRLAETILADPHADAAALDALLYSLDRGILAIEQLRVWAQEEQEEARARRRSARLN
jgi:hypothetical protein